MESVPFPEEPNSHEADFSDDFLVDNGDNNDGNLVAAAMTTLQPLEKKSDDDYTHSLPSTLPPLLLLNNDDDNDCYDNTNSFSTFTTLINGTQSDSANHFECERLTDIPVDHQEESDDDEDIFYTPLSDDGYDDDDANSTSTITILVKGTRSSSTNHFNFREENDDEEIFYTPSASPLPPLDDDEIKPPLDLSDILTRFNHEIYVKSVDDNTLLSFVENWCYAQNYTCEEIFDQLLEVAKSNTDYASLLAFFYSNGIGHSPSREMGFNWYCTGAESDDLFGCNQLGIYYLKGLAGEKNEEEAFYWFSKAAYSGYSSGMASLGECYNKGTGVKQDRFKWFWWHQKAAERGNTTGEFSLAFCYLYGKGGAPLDVHEALRLYLKLERKGSKSVMNSIKWVFQAL